MDKYNKCKFCKYYDSYEGCIYGCNNYEDYIPDKDRIKKFAKEEGINVADVIALINM